MLIYICSKLPLKNNNKTNKKKKLTSTVAEKVELLMIDQYWNDAASQLTITLYSITVTVLVL